MASVSRMIQFSLVSALAGMVGLGALAAPSFADGDDMDAYHRQYLIKRTSPDQCRPVDLRDARPALGDFLHHPRNQSDEGWCYAYAAADLLSFKTGKRLSAVDAALTYNHEVDNDILSRGIRRVFMSSDDQYQGGFIRKAALYAAEHGVCSEEIIPSSKNYWGSSTKTDFAALQACLKLADQKNVSPQESLKMVVSSTRGQNYSCSTASRELFPKASPQSILLSGVAADASNQNETMYQAARVACRDDRQVIDPLRVVSYDRDPNSTGFSLFSSLDQQLDQGRIVGIAYHPLALLNQDSNVFQRFFSGHASVIVAREFRDGQCKYLVRNSWGSGCSYYKDNIRKDCIDSEGAFWIPEEDLDPILEEIVFIP